jgi:hypothetical protein
VFRVETVASANGKDIVNDHPSEDVTPINWRALSHGTLMNPRRGIGIEDDFLVGDLLVKSPEGIELVESGKVELSMGYDAGYVITGPGRGYQRDIVYNHVALVDKGRCGPRCSIGDRQYIQEKTMSGTTQRAADKLRSSTGVGRVLDRIRKAFKAGDEEMLEETLGDAEEELERREPAFEIHNHNHAAPAGDTEMSKEDEDDKKTEDRIRRAIGDALKPVLDALDARLKDMEENFEKGKDKGRDKGKDKDPDDDDDKTEDNEKILGALELEAPPGTNDRARKARDSAYLVDSFQETVALAEVLSPGIRVPTFDAKHEPTKSYDTICNLRRTSLDLAYATPEGRGLVDAVGGANYKTMDCTALRPVFMAAGALKKSRNNETRTTDTNIRASGGGVGGAKLTLRQINENNRKHYASK